MQACIPQAQAVQEKQGSLASQPADHAADQHLLKKEWYERQGVLARVLQQADQSNRQKHRHGIVAARF